MSDHLPECVMTENNDDDRFSSWLIDECICDRLRAAEQRGYDKGWDEAVVRYVDGWADAVQAARDAVEALTAGRERMDYEDGPEVYGAHNAYIDCVVDTLAAIDALVKP